MAKFKIPKRKIPKKIRTAISIISICFAIVALSTADLLPFDAPNLKDKSGQKIVADASVHIIDCGQGDSVLIRQGKSTALIDATTKDMSDNVIDYLNSQGIKRIDAFILTHPDADHIGGAESVINNFSVSKIYMEKPKGDNIPTTRTYENLLDTIMDKGLKIKDPSPNEKLEIGEFVITFLGPVKNMDDSNNNSIVARGDYEDVSFLFTGDASSDAEEELLKVNANLDCDILKVGHHGSSSSTTMDFLKEVSPETALISCGKNNSYGHPHSEVLKNLSIEKVKVYRTDFDGDIVVATDGESYDVQINN